MLYAERRPAAPLSRFVRLLWRTRGWCTPHQRERVLPNGCVQIVLNLARDFICDCSDDGATNRLSHSLLVGPRSLYGMIDTSDLADVVGIAFEPVGFAAFAKDRVDLFSDRQISLDAVWGSKARALRDRLGETAGTHDKFDIVENFLSDLLEPDASPKELVVLALNRMGRTPVLPSIHAVAQESGYGARRFSQVFREQVGFTPKMWCRLQRFQHAVEQLHAGKDVRWAELALECGYYDQAHFANEFRAFSGIQVSTYSSQRSCWANHVVVR